MNLNEVIQKMTEKEYTLEMGANKLAKWWKTTPDIIREAKKKVRRDLAPTQPAKILVFDIEVSPTEAFVWNMWKTNVNPQMITREWFILTWSAKWLYEDKILSDRLTGKEALVEDDSRLVKGLWKLLNEADIVIAHNGDNYDVPRMNTRFILNNLKPTSPYKTIDTLKVARKHFSFSHNGLDALAKVFGLGGKLHTGMELWTRCLKGEDKALKEMEIYNQKDITLLEDVYLKLRPWIKGHPNLGLFIDTDEPICPTCTSDNLKWEGHHNTGVSRFPAFTCNKCGASGRARHSVVPKSKRTELTVSITG